MRYALALIAVIFALGPVAAHAQETPCPAGTLAQHDLAGIYVDPSLPMRVKVWPCSGVTITWDNPYGRHQAYYSMSMAVPSGGVIGHGRTPDPSVGYLDNATTLGVKPAEVGFIQVLTVDPYGNIVGVYRLPKMPS
jgi:hypothetical protein